MKTFDIHIRQIVEQDFKIEASSREEAERIAEEKYNSGEFDPVNTEGDISHDIEIFSKNENRYIHHLHKVLKDLIKSNVLLNDLLAICSMEWLYDSADDLKIDRKVMDKHEDLILSIASEKYLKSNPCEYFSSIDTATAGAYLACYVHDKFNVNPHEALSWMLKNDVFYGCEDDSIRCLFNFDEEKFEKEYVNSLNKENKRYENEVIF